MGILFLWLIYIAYYIDLVGKECSDAIQNTLAVILKVGLSLLPHLPERFYMPLSSLKVNLQVVKEQKLNLANSSEFSGNKSTMITPTYRPISQCHTRTLWYPDRKNYIKGGRDPFYEWPHLFKSVIFGFSPKFIKLSKERSFIMLQLIASWVYICDIKMRRLFSH